jgi:phosphoesterase RecJ-like protein
MTKIGVDKAAELIRSANAILLVGHTDPDGDCLGSLYALKAGIRSLGKKASVYLKKPLPLKYRFLSDELEENTDIPECDLIVALDTPQLKRLDIDDPAKLTSPILAIDHHPGEHTEFAYALWDDGKSACAMLIKALLQVMAITITPKMAGALYAGIVTDTNSFVNQNTYADTFQAAGELTELGAKPDEIAKYVYGSLTPGDISALSYALSTLELYDKDRIAVMSLKREWQNEGNDTDTELFVNYARSLVNTEVAIMLTETKEGVRVNLRAKNAYDVSAVARKLGGGGHKAAAGIRMNCPLEEAKKLLLENIKFDD